MELQILDLLVSNGGTMQYVDVIKSFPSGVETNGFLQLLRRDDYIQCSFEPYSHVVITPAGRAYRSKLQSQKDDRQRIEDAGNRQTKYGLVSAIFSVVAAVLTFLSLAFVVLQHFNLI